MLLVPVICTKGCTNLSSENTCITDADKTPVTQATVTQVQAMPMKIRRLQVSNSRVGTREEAGELNRDYVALQPGSARREACRTSQPFHHTGADGATSKPLPKGPFFPDSVSSAPRSLWGRRRRALRGEAPPRAACPTLPPDLRGPPGPARGLKPPCRGCKYPRTAAPADPPPPPPRRPRYPLPASERHSPRPAQPRPWAGRAGRPQAHLRWGRGPLASGRDAATLRPPAGGSACPAPPPAQLPRLSAPLTSRPPLSGPRALVRAVAGARARRERRWGGVRRRWRRLRVSPGGRAALSGRGSSPGRRPSPSL